MSRIRTIKPEWLEDERLLEAGNDARVLSIALILLADDSGRGRLSPVTAARVFPMDSRVFREALARLRGWFVREYRVRGQSYFEIVNWRKHQRIDRPSKPRTPDPTEGEYVDSLTDEPLTPPPDTTPSRDTRETLATDLDLDRDLDQYQERERDPRARARGEPSAAPASSLRLVAEPSKLERFTEWCWRAWWQAYRDATTRDPRQSERQHAEPFARACLDQAHRFPQWTAKRWAGRVAAHYLADPYLREHPKKLRLGNLVATIGPRLDELEAELEAVG